METPEDPYLCVGICMADPDSGYCLGCGRPPLGSPQVVAEPVPQARDAFPGDTDPDTPTDRPAVSSDRRQDDV